MIASCIRLRKKRLRKKKAVYERKILEKPTQECQSSASTNQTQKPLEIMAVQETTQQLCNQRTTYQ